METGDQLIHEVDEEVRRERLQKFWQNFGSYIVAASVFFLVAVIAFVIWQGYDQRQRERWTAQLLEAKERLESNATQEAEAALTQVKIEGSETLSTLAALWLTQLYLKEEENEKARAVAQELMGRPSMGVYAAYGKLLAEQTGALPADDAASSGPFRLTQEEARALTLLSQGERDKAIETLRRIAEDAVTPVSMRERALTLAPLTKPRKEESQAQ